MFYYLFKYLHESRHSRSWNVSLYIFQGIAGCYFLVINCLDLWQTNYPILAKKTNWRKIRDLGLEGQMQKRGTPTMGGIIIIASIVIPTILLADIFNVYIILMLVTTLWLGFIGGLDDYIKVYKKNKKGLEGKFKIVGQIVLGFNSWLNTVAKRQCSCSRKACA